MYGGPSENIVCHHGELPISMIGFKFKARKVFEIVAIFFFSDEVFSVAALIVVLNYFLQ